MLRCGMLALLSTTALAMQQGMHMSHAGVAGRTATGPVVPGR
jgi:hypothetical protein